MWELSTEHNGMMSKMFMTLLLLSSRMHLAPRPQILRMEIDCKSVAKNPRKKTSQHVSKSVQISGDNPVETIQKIRESGSLIA
jgi:hypothetical protein